MSRPAIVVDSLGKSYRIGRKADPNASFRDVIVGAVASPFRRLRRAGDDGDAKTDETFWALRDVSFEVQPGEVVGVIGRNGAGKSTLLKILSRITEPTTGSVRLRGRVASLLEVGTGFHPELTGRENIYLNGAILGMKRAEISRKFDEIVAFAEVEKFLDTPVKRYSSGMYVRLAFAVAAHLEPEILIVDEVLAVGDAEFQKKCIGKMKDIAEEGERTVLFVSHNMAAISALCTRGIVLRQGDISLNDDISRAISFYLRSLDASRVGSIATMTERRGKGRVRFANVRLVSEGGGAGLVQVGDACRVEFALDGLDTDVHCIFTVYDAFGQPMASFNSQIHAPCDRRRLMEDRTLTCEIDEMLLMPGSYRMNVAIQGDGELQDHLEGAAHFEVAPGLVRGRPVESNQGFARLTMPHRWLT